MYCVTKLASEDTFIVAIEAVQLATTKGQVKAHTAEFIAYSQKKKKRLVKV